MVAELTAADRCSSATASTSNPSRTLPATSSPIQTLAASSRTATPAAPSIAVSHSRSLSMQQQNQSGRRGSCRKPESCSRGALSLHLMQGPAGVEAHWRAAQLHFILLLLLCCRCSVTHAQSGIPTPEPTLSPTQLDVSGTPQPTGGPTIVPTPEPTPELTPAPTLLSSTFPTPEPTPQPTPAPIMDNPGTTRPTPAPTIGVPTCPGALMSFDASKDPALASELAYASASSPGAPMLRVYEGLLFSSRAWQLAAGANASAAYGAPGYANGVVSPGMVVLFLTNMFGAATPIGGQYDDGTTQVPFTLHYLYATSAAVEGLQLTLSAATVQGKYDQLWAPLVTRASVTVKLSTKAPTLIQFPGTFSGINALYLLPPTGSVVVLDNICFSFGGGPPNPPIAPHPPPPADGDRTAPTPKKTTKRKTTTRKTTKRKTTKRKTTKRTAIAKKTKAKVKKKTKATAAHNVTPHKGKGTQKVTAKKAAKKKTTHKKLIGKKTTKHKSTKRVAGKQQSTQHKAVTHKKTTKYKAKKKTTKKSLRHGWLVVSG